MYIKYRIGRTRSGVLFFYALHEWGVGEYDGIASVFSVPNSPGRIYVEASSSLKAFELLKCAEHVYWNNMYVVPVHERQQLLSPERTRKDVKPGGWVRLRSGLYRRDIGQVQDGGRQWRIPPRESRPKEINPQFQ